MAMTLPADASGLQALLDKHAIGEVLLGYSRAIDRLDADLMRRVYWEDAVDDHAVFKGDVEKFIAYSFPFMRDAISQHRIFNMWIDLLGPNTAFSETYFSGFHDFPNPPEGRLERIVGGRYLDRHEKRGNEWRIIARTVVVDWYHERAANSCWTEGRYANLEHRPGHKPNDPLYDLHPDALGTPRG